MKAQNEGEALQHMAMQFRAGGGLLSGFNPWWVDAKVRALQYMDLHAQKLHGRPIYSLLDIGVGDMRHLEAWDRFGEVYYMGVDGCQAVVDAAQKRHTDRLFIHQPISELVSGSMADVMPPDAILLLDVLYHLPDGQLELALLNYVYDSPAEYILLSHATDTGQLREGASRMGEPGFAWFPRQWRRPQGWDIIHAESCNVDPAQRLVLLTRSGN